MIRKLAGLSGLVLITWPLALVLAQEPGDVAAGAALARTWCSNCHVIGKDAVGSPSDAAPSFASVAGQPQTTQFSLRVFLQTHHRNMPNYQLSRTEMDDVVAYILSLRDRP